MQEKMEGQAGAQQWATAEEEQLNTMPPEQEHSQEERAPGEPEAREPEGAPEDQPAPDEKRKMARTARLVGSLFGVGMLLALVLLWNGVRLDRLSKLPALAQGEKISVKTHEVPLDSDGLTTTEIVNKVAPSVVSIELYEKGQREAVGAGSGIVFDSNGYIVTNAHVVEESDRIGVLLNDGRFFEALLVGVDVRNDLAVLKIKADDLQPADFGDSSQVVVGQRAVAIGNAAGLFPGSPTQGIISGVDRRLDVSTQEGYVKMRLLQTDAAINPGNSGGALVNIHGQVIGINIAKLQSVEIDNIGFAIPSNVAIPVIESLIELGEVAPPPMLGVNVSVIGRTLPVDESLPAGLLIEEITPESNLGSFGVSVGDIILEVEGRTMEDTSDLLLELQQKFPGETLNMRVYIVETGEIVEATPLLYERTS